MAFKAGAGSTVLACASERLDGEAWTEGRAGEAGEPRAGDCLDCPSPASGWSEPVSDCCGTCWYPSGACSSSSGPSGPCQEFHRQSQRWRQYQSWSSSSESLEISGKSKLRLEGSTPSLSSFSCKSASWNSSNPSVSRTRKVPICSWGRRRKLKYSDMMAAAFGKLLRTRGDEAKRCSNRETPLSPSNSRCDQDMANSLADPVKREISLLAAYFRWDDLVDPTYQPISLIYLRQVREDPSQEGIVASGLSFTDISHRRAHPGADWAKAQEQLVPRYQCR